MPSGDFGSRGEDESDRLNKEKITLSEDDMEDLEVFVPGISSTTISYSTNASVEGGELESSSNYTIAGVLANYEQISNLSLSIGQFLSEDDEDGKEKVCVLGYSVAKEVFGSAYDAYDEIVYIDSRPYVVTGVLDEMGTVASGINPDSAIFIPYSTGIKYLTGEDVSPTITVIAEDVSEVDTVIANIETVLLDSYPNAEFTISDAGSKMEAASASNETLTVLLIAMAVIVFIVGGIGIMNVLFVSVKERTNEIGVLKALGCSRKDILLEFLMEAACTSLVGAILGVMLALGITPLVEAMSVRVILILGKRRENTEDDEITLKEGQYYVYGQITSINGNEMIYDEVVIKEQNKEGVTEETSGQMPQMGSGGRPEMPEGEDGQMPQRGSGERPEMSGEKGGRMSEMGSVERTEMSGDTAGQMPELGNEEMVQKMQGTQYEQTGESVMVQIPVGTQVTTKLGTVTTFSRLAAGDTIKMLMQEENGEQVVVEIWIVD